MVSHMLTHRQHRWSVKNDISYECGLYTICLLIRKRGCSYEHGGQSKMIAHVCAHREYGGKLKGKTVVIARMNAGDI